MEDFVFIKTFDIRFFSIIFILLLVTLNIHTMNKDYLSDEIKPLLILYNLGTPLPFMFTFCSYQLEASGVIIEPASCTGTRARWPRPPGSSAAGSPTLTS